jgi:hypothetical protein
MIVGQNALLNQYVPTFFIKNLRDGQGVIYDSTRKAFVNADLGAGATGADRLGQLLDVSDSVDNPLALQNGQGLVYNSLSSQWENRFVDFNTLLNRPANIGSVSSVSIVTANGITGSVLNPTTTPEITLTLGNITPSRVTSTGTVTGLNLTGTNTGDQTIVLSGDATGSGTGTLPMTLTTVNLSPGVYGDDHLVPTITVNAKGLVTSITTQHVDTTIRDLVPLNETFIVSPRHQYIVTTQLEVDGLIENYGVIAIL